MLLVPSGSTPGLCHEVEASIGWCSCPSGRQGAFCKHQALVHRAYGGLFPNAPAIDGKSRHELAYLALGDKCPPLRFYQSPSERNSEVSQSRTHSFFNYQCNLTTHLHGFPSATEYWHARVKLTRHSAARDAPANIRSPSSLLWRIILSHKGMFWVRHSSWKN